MMPVRDRAALVEASVRSILEQTESRFELLVFDDGSRDDTRAVLERLAATDTRIHVSSTPRSIGIPAARNQLLATARGRYMAVCDSDDLSRPERFARELALLEADAGLVGVGARFSLFDAAAPPRSPDGSPVDDEPAWHHDLRAGRLPFGTPTAMLRTSAVREAGGYDETYPLAEDLRLCYALAGRGGRFATVDEVLVDVRAHTGSISRTPAQLRAREWHNLRAQLAGLRSMRGRFNLRGWLVIGQSILRVGTATLRSIGRSA